MLDDYHLVAEPDVHDVQDYRVEQVLSRTETGMGGVPVLDICPEGWKDNGQATSPLNIPHNGGRVASTTSVTIGPSIAAFCRLCRPGKSEPCDEDSSPLIEPRRAGVDVNE